jgi:UDP-N-acetylglucosamine acyltransferase
VNETIHPTAVVAPSACLGARVRIGAYTVVGPEAVLGDDVELGHHVVLEGRVVLAEGVRIGHGSIVGGVPQDLKFKDATPSGVRIGARTVLREHVTVHRATTPEGWTEIGREGLIMGLAHVAHDCRLGDGVIVINYAGITGHCQIGDRVTVGGLTGMVPFTRIGTGAYVGGMAKINADVPPFMLVEGQPATVRGINVIGLRRAGMPPAERRALQEAYRLLYRSGLAPKRALDRVREEVEPCLPVTALVDFIAGATRHGICGPPRGAGDDEGEENQD